MWWGVRGDVVGCDGRCGGGVWWATWWGVMGDVVVGCGGRRGGV